MDDVDITASSEMVRLLEKLAPEEGYTQSALDGVRLVRSDRPLGRTLVLYEPSIVIVCQGRKRGFLGDEVYLYDAQNYLVLSVPLPFYTETEASRDTPLLAVAIRLDLTQLAELVLLIDRAGGQDAADAPLGIMSTPLQGVLAEATLRLLRALTSPLDAHALGPAIVREIHYRVLMGERGGALRAALAHQGRFGRIAKALGRIHADFARPLDVGDLAREAEMSVPAFHANFRRVTRTSPIQYIKSTRLHHARLMMIRDGLTAAAASARVGYESPSQFSREFKRFFGRPPADEAREMKASFQLSSAAGFEGF
ncbi:AraC family transcriptional regulator [Bordetella bronchialis]|uniref:AraC family transcriptional regulator n=1 Tax=Bordetella bronchialis TaxID=463025 RepID=A0ABN4R1C7_9BORD|nr:AraC family transcriptional regulator [Bordetella bronchialis]ANN65493.1 AraC family transcriptional regulator [Bordetella bronchialis]